MLRHKIGALIIGRGFWGPLKCVFKGSMRVLQRFQGSVVQSPEFWGSGVWSLASRVLGELLKVGTWEK